MTNPPISAPTDASGKLTGWLGERPGKTLDQVNLYSQSVAGEEDPGASLDMPVGPVGPVGPVRPVGQPAGELIPRPPGVINPDDEAA